jgi:hypothetical protein
VIFVIFVREHNRKCDQLRSINGDSWDDDTYFQEARKWVIALIQKINYLEYCKFTLYTRVNIYYDYVKISFLNFIVPILLGIPLPEFTEYDPNLVPGINSVFVTTTMRYGHSEVR